MIEKVDYRTIVDVLTVIGWIAGLYLIVRTALRFLVSRHRPETGADVNLAAQINRDLLREIAHQLKEQTELYHQLATKLAVLESRQQGMEAEIKSKR